MLSTVATMGNYSVIYEDSKNFSDERYLESVIFTLSFKSFCPDAQKNKKSDCTITLWKYQNWKYQHIIFPDAIFHFVAKIVQINSRLCCNFFQNILYMYAQWFTGKNIKTTWICMYFWQIKLSSTFLCVNQCCVHVNSIRLYLI